MVKLINGDLLEAKETYIAHQVNCYGAMGRGVAVQIIMNTVKIIERRIFLGGC